MAAMLIGIVPLLPGLAHGINPSLKVARGALEYYTLSWLVGLILTFVAYYVLFLVFPHNVDPNYELQGEEDVEASPSESVDGAVSYTHLTLPTKRIV